MSYRVRLWILSFLLMLFSSSILLANPVTTDTVAIAYGETKSGAISVNGEVDVFQFNGTAGDIIIIQMHSTNGNDSLDSRIELKSPTGTVIEKSQSRFLARIERILLSQTGVYEIQVSDGGNDTTGTYELSLQKVNPPAGATTLNYGTLVTDSLVNITELKAFTFTGTAGEIFVAQVTNSTIGSDIKVEIYDNTGFRLRNSSDPSLTFIDTVQVSNTGTYVILVTSKSGTATGTFKIIIQRVVNPANPTAISYGSLTADTLALLGDLKTYTFNATSGEAINLRALDLSSTTFKPQLILYDPSGDRITSANDQDYVKIPSVQLSATGTYTLILNDFTGNPGGAFKLYLQRLLNPVNGVALNYSVNKSDSLTTTGEVKSYTLTGTANDLITFVVRDVSNTITSVVDFYDSSGTLLTSIQENNNVSRIDTLRLSYTGDYTILVSEFSGLNTGTFAILTQDINSPTSATTISYGDNFIDTLFSPIDLDVYTFNATSGERIIVQMQDVSGVMQPQLELYNSQGIRLQKVNANELAQIDALEITQTGTYTLFAYDRDFNSSGNYALFFQRTTNPVGATAISYGSSFIDSLTIQAELRGYTFTGTAGDRLLVNMRDVTGILEPAFELYDPSGVELVNFTGNNNFARLDTLTLSSTGTYTLFTYDIGTNDTGVYGLFFDRLVNAASATAATYGTLVRDTLLNSGELKIYTFDATSGDIFVSLMSDSLSPMEPKLELFSPTGTLITSHTNNDFAKLDTVPLPTTGTYILIAEDNQTDETGSYSLLLQKTNPPVGPRNIAYGSSTVDSLTKAAQIKSFSFTAAANDTAFISLQESSLLKAAIEIFNPAGNKIAFASTNGTINITKLPLADAGTYHIFVSDDNGTQAGTFTLTLQVNPPVFTGVPDTVQFRADSSAQMDIWSFVTDPDDPDSSLTYEFFPGNDSLITSYNTATGILTLTSTVNYTGTTTLKLKATDSNGSFDEFTLTVIILDPSPTTLIKPVTAGWNMLGLPGTAADMFYKSVFPSANNNTLFGFNGGYFLEDTFQVGVGYWLNFPADTTYNILTTPSYQLSLTLTQGWNMISGPACKVAVTDISDPGGIITPNTLFEFNNGYVASDTVAQGKGYWLNANANGVITITCSGFKTIPKASLANIDWQSFPTLRLSASDEAEQSLYFGVALDDDLPLAARQLPPLPPSGAFDARFQDDYRLINGIEGVIHLQAPRYPVDIEVSNLQNTDLGDQPLLLVEMRGGKEVRSHRVSNGAVIRISDPRVHTLKLTQNAAVPATFEVWQNYPNPFNPTTQIKFAIPEKSPVEVTIFNSLGQKVKTLLNETRDPGFYTVSWDGRSDAGFQVSSGIYFYKVKYTDHTRVMKMILLR